MFVFRTDTVLSAHGAGATESARNNNRIVRMAENLAGSSVVMRYKKRRRSDDMSVVADGRRGQRVVTLSHPVNKTGQFNIEQRKTRAVAASEVPGGLSCATSLANTCRISGLRHYCASKMLMSLLSTLLVMKSGLPSWFTSLTSMRQVPRPVRKGDPAAR